MARKIGTRRGKSPIKTRLEQERKAGRKDPEGKKSFRKGLEIASLVIPGSLGVKAGAKATKAAQDLHSAVFTSGLRKAVKKKAGAKAAKAKKPSSFAEKDRLDQKATDKFWETHYHIKDKNLALAEKALKERKALLKKIEKLDKPMKQSTKKVAKKKKGVPLSVKSIPLLLERSSNLKSKKKKAGGIVKSRRGDGIARSGRTKGRIV
jgi:hypothetical protein